MDSPPDNDTPHEEPSELSDEFSSHDDVEDWIIGEVLAGQISPAEAAERLEIPVGAILKLCRERSGETIELGELKQGVDDEDSELFTKNWQRAHRDADPQEAELPPLEALINSFPPARWLFGTDRRRIATALATCVLAGGCVIYIATKKRDEVPTGPTLDPPSSALISEAEFAAARELARAFLAADRWEERVKYVRNSSTTKHLMQSWYEDSANELRVVADAQFATVRGTYVQGIPFVILATIRYDAEPWVLQIDVSGSEPKVDWESHVHFQPMTWDEFKTQRPSEPQAFRVRAEASDYFIEPFADGAGFLSLRLTCPFGIVGLNGFAPRGTQLALRLENLVQFSDKSAKNLTLWLSFPSTEERTPAVAITDVIEGWIIP